MWPPGSCLPRMGNPAWDWVGPPSRLVLLSAKRQNLGSKNPKILLFLTPAAKGKFKKTTVLFEQNKQRSILLTGIAINLTGMNVLFHLYQKLVELQV